MVPSSLPQIGAVDVKCYHQQALSFLTDGGCARVCACDSVGPSSFLCLHSFSSAIQSSGAFCIWPHGASSGGLCPSKAFVPGYLIFKG